MFRNEMSRYKDINCGVIFRIPSFRVPEKEVAQLLVVGLKLEEML